MLNAARVQVCVGQDDHLAIVVCEQGLEGLVVDVGSGAIPIGHQAEPVEDDAELAAHDWSKIRPTMIGPAFPADCLKFALWNFPKYGFSLQYTYEHMITIIVSKYYDCTLFRNVFPMTCLTFRKNRVTLQLRSASA